MALKKKKNEGSGLSNDTSGLSNDEYGLSNEGKWFPNSRFVDLESGLNLVYGINGSQEGVLWVLD